MVMIGEAMPKRARASAALSRLSLRGPEAACVFGIGNNEPGSPKSRHSSRVVRSRNIASSLHRIASD